MRNKKLTTTLTTFYRTVWPTDPLPKAFLQLYLDSDTHRLILMWHCESKLSSLGTIYTPALMTAHANCPGLVQNRKVQLQTTGMSVWLHVSTLSRHISKHMEAIFSY